MSKYEIISSSIIKSIEAILTSIASSQYSKEIWFGFIFAKNASHKIAMASSRLRQMVPSRLSNALVIMLVKLSYQRLWSVSYFQCRWSFTILCRRKKTWTQGRVLSEGEWHRSIQVNPNAPKPTMKTLDNMRPSQPDQSARHPFHILAITLSKKLQIALYLRCWKLDSIHFPMVYNLHGLTQPYGIDLKRFEGCAT